MASETTPPPKPTFTVEISVGSCDWERLVDELQRAARYVQRHGTACKRVWAVRGAHGHVRIEQRDVTREQYEREMMVWCARGAPEVG